MAYEDKRDGIIRENIPAYVLQSIQCNVCLNIMDNPTVASNCGHSACGSCLSMTEKCPMRCGPSQPSCINYTILAILSQLPAKCHLECPWTGLYSGLDVHLQTDCPYEVCQKSCGSKIDRGTYMIHKDMCTKETVKCQSCELLVERGMLNNHQQKHCQKATLTCPKCNIQISRESFPLHTVMCKERPRPCSIHGCKGIITDRTEEEHFRVAASSHVSLQQLERRDLLTRAYASPTSVGLAYSLVQVDHRKFSFLVNTTLNGKIRFPLVTCFGAKWMLTIERNRSVITSLGLCMTQTAQTKYVNVEVVFVDAHGKEDNVWKLKKEFKENGYVKKDSFSENVKKIVLFFHHLQFEKI